MKPSTSPSPSSPSPIYQILFPLLFPLAGCLTGTPLPPCECVAPSSENPPINRYYTAKRNLYLSMLSAVGVALRFKDGRIYSSHVYSSGFHAWLWNVVLVEMFLFFFTSVVSFLFLVWLFVYLFFPCLMLHSGLLYLAFLVWCYCLFMWP